MHLIGCLEDVPTEFNWLVDTTEKWCRDRAIYLALMESIHIADGKDDKKNRDSIPSILSDALAVSFDTHIGHDYLLDYEKRYESYHKKEDKIEFDLEYFNKITKGGLPNKTLNIALAGTGVGKSLFMCHVAAACLLQGRNVLYITLEMAEERIAERIDANLLNVPIQDITELPKQMFENKVTSLAKKTQGTLIIKEYPTASAHAGHFKSLLNELALKKSFRPDIIFIDYLNICSSSRYRGNANINSYTFVKAIAEELRGLAVEFNVPIVSATQTTRSGYGSSDVELTDTSESFGLPATADLMFALISTEELEGLGQILVKQLKNRYNDPTIHKRFVIGIDRAKMRLYDCEQSAQQDILDNGKDEEYDYEEKKPKKSFEGFKF
jgi:archaellum biogenesis ATPase FlaH